jgi:hypothetical protein
MANQFWLDYRKQRSVFTSPDRCPICHNFVTIDRPVAHVFDDLAQIVFRCPNYDCGRLFIAYYDLEPKSGPVLLAMQPSAVAHEQMPKIIEEISPDFVSIYREAHTAKEKELLQICGPGYRKAFEFLIKDYAKRQVASEEEKSGIEKTFSGKVVKEYVGDPRIQAVAKRALWLGNDETHYLRKWTDHDIEDLITLIHLTVRWIEIEQLTLKYADDMPG